MFWKEILSWIAIYSNEVKDITFLDVLFGTFDIDKDLTVINHVLLFGIFFIYRCKLGEKLRIKPGSEPRFEPGSKLGFET